MNDIEAMEYLGQFIWITKKKTLLPLVRTGYHETLTTSNNKIEP